MIPAPRGLVARYKQTLAHQDGNTSTYHDEKDVIAFNEHGIPLVVDSKNGQLVPAARWGNYDGVDESSRSPIVALMPAHGWRVEWTTSDGQKWSEPLLGWGLKANGDVVALDTDSSGLVTDTDDSANEPRIYHPSTDSGSAENVTHVDTLPPAVHTDSRIVVHGYAVEIGGLGRHEWFFFRHLEPALAFGRAGRTAHGVTDYRVRSAAHETRCDPDTGADQRLIHVRNDNLDRQPGEIHHLTRWVRGIDPASSHWSPPSDPTRQE